ncbi:hypothetical protein CBS101457_003844 [Exobasidium rhododendri]|nr:hypothetical protein CBS101457_003844 [Exobasidium rhododendri]
MRMIVAAGLLWCSALCLVTASQMPFGASYTSSNDGFGESRRIELPLEGVASSDSSSIENTIAAENGKHVVLTHKEFPHISLRIKKTSSKTKTGDEMLSAQSGIPSPSYNTSDPTAFCDPTVASWSGYVDTIDGKSLFFYFFESRNDPSKDPVLLWLTGGPGCSSSLGLFMELGPCSIPERKGKISSGPPINGTVWNPYSWNNGASIFFLDQPVDVGYSYSRYGIHTYDTDTGSKDVYAFLRIFFNAFEKFQDNDFVITGESYAGRYIPRYASQIIDQNKKIIDKANRSGEKAKKGDLVNLKKVAIGNGLTDVQVQTPSYYDFTCTRKGGVDPILSIETCKRLRTWRDRCLKWIKAECRDTYDSDGCMTSANVCGEEFTSAFFETGRNPYNVEDLCLAGYEPNLCYSNTQDIRAYMDREDVRELLGAEPVSHIGKFQSCNNDVAQGFGMHNDEAIQNVDYVAGLLERDIDVMIYVGKLDWICNHLGNRAWVEKMDWTDKAEFHKSEQYTWVVDGKDAGTTQKGGGLTWATVEGAGHMVPLDKPKVALEMLTRFLDGDKL